MQHYFLFLSKRPKKDFFSAVKILIIVEKCYQRIIFWKILKQKNVRQNPCCVGSLLQYKWLITKHLSATKKSDTRHVTQLGQLKNLIKLVHSLVNTVISIAFKCFFLCCWPFNHIILTHWICLKLTANIAEMRSKHSYERYLPTLQTQYWQQVKWCFIFKYTRFQYQYAFKQTCLHIQE